MWHWTTTCSASWKRLLFKWHIPLLLTNYFTFFKYTHGRNSTLCNVYMLVFAGLHVLTTIIISDFEPHRYYQPQNRMHCQASNPLLRPFQTIAALERNDRRRPLALVFSWYKLLCDSAQLNLVNPSTCGTHGTRSAHHLCELTQRRRENPRKEKKGKVQIW